VQRRNPDACAKIWIASSLLKDFHFHLGDAPLGHVQLLGSRIGDVKRSSSDEGAAVVHPDNHRAPGVETGNAHAVDKFLMGMTTLPR